MPETSIVMCSYRRAAQLERTLRSIHAQAYKDFEIVLTEDGDDGGATRSICEAFGVRYFQRKNRPDQPYSNPAIPWNCSIRRAEGEILILQNPECEHEGEVIEALVAPHRAERDLAVLASVAAMTPEGRQWAWYTHSQHSPRPLFFCGSVLREHVFRVRGYDEDFGRGRGGYGYDDNFFALCLSTCGVKFVFRDDILVRHLWHEATNCYGLKSNEELFNRKILQYTNGEIGPECNVGRDWGDLNS